MTTNIRDIEDKDLPGVLHLLDEQRRGSHEFVPLAEEGLLAWMQEGRLKTFVAEEDLEIVSTAAYHDGHWSEVEWVAVVPNMRSRKSVENLLVAEVEKQVKKEQLFTSVDEGSPSTSDWIARGCNSKGGLYQMVADLDGPRSLPKVPDDVILRSLRPNEEAEFVKAVNAGFAWEILKPDEVHKWRAEAPYLTEEWIHVAKCDGRIISVVVAKQEVMHSNHFNGNRGYLGPAATLPEYRGKNLASALTRRAMNFLFEKGMNSVALYTQEQNVASVSMVRKLGFRVGHYWKFMRRSLTSWHACYGKTESKLLDLDIWD